MKPDDLAELKGKIEGLKADAGELDTHIGALDRDMERLETQQIDKKDQRQVFSEFAQIYTQISSELKLRILNILVEVIRCSVKRGEETVEVATRSGETEPSWKHVKRQNKTRSQTTPIAEVRLPV